MGKRWCDGIYRRKFSDLLLAGSGTYRIGAHSLRGFEMQKKKMSRLSSANTHSSIVLLHKRHAGNPNYSSSTEICRIDGLRAEAFLYCVGVQAVYLSPGEHNIEVNAHWARHIRGKRFKEYEAGPHHLCVEVGHGELWSLEYFIPEKKFIFSRCNEKKMFKKSVV